MTAYIFRRFALMIPTLFGIMLVSFIVVQFLPGGPIERMIAQLRGTDVSATARFSGGGGDLAHMSLPGADAGMNSRYAGARGLDPELIKGWEKDFGFDKPPHERFLLMMGNYLTFDFGQSYFRKVDVLQLIREKLPVSISIGLWLTLISYTISIPLGIRKAVKDGTNFDIWTSTAVVVGHAIPAFTIRDLFDRAFCRRLVFRLVSAAGATVGRSHAIELAIEDCGRLLAPAMVRRFHPAELAREGHRLFLASCLAAHRDGHILFRHNHFPDQKLVSG